MAPVIVQAIARLARRRGAKHRRFCLRGRADPRDRCCGRRAEAAKVTSPLGAIAAKLVHAALDAAAAAAYGWDDHGVEMPDHEAPRRLLALNLARAAQQG